MTEKRKSYSETLEKQLSEWSAEIKQFRTKAEGAKAELKVEQGKLVDSLQVKHDEVQGKLKELNAATNETWESLKTSAEASWQDVKKIFANAATKFSN